MSTWQRLLLWSGVIALGLFVFVINGTVSTLKTTVQGHNAALDKPAIDAAVFPGVPAVFAEAWHGATHGKNPTPQDYLWLTLHLANQGQQQARSLTAEVLLVPAIGAIYAGNETVTSPPAVVTESTGQTRATFAFLSLAPGRAHTVFIALRPDGIVGPPYETLAQRQWVAQYRAYWTQFTVTTDEHAPFVQYGFAPLLPVRQAAGGASAGVSMPAGGPQSTARNTP